MQAQLLLSTLLLLILLLLLSSIDYNWSRLMRQKLLSGAGLLLIFDDCLDHVFALLVSHQGASFLYDAINLRCCRLGFGGRSRVITDLDHCYLYWCDLALGLLGKCLLGSFVVSGSAFLWCLKVAYYLKRVCLFDRVLLLSWQL